MESLRTAVLSGNEEVVEELLGNQEVYDWGWRDDEGRTVLELASVLGQFTIVRKILQSGASSGNDELSVSSYGALHLACVWGRTECVKELVRGGADHLLRTKHGETPLQLSLRYNKNTCANFLRSFEAQCVLQRKIREVKMMEPVSGRWSKEDKTKVIALCQEKINWLEEDEAKFEDIQQQTRDFDLRIQPYLNKLAE